MEVEQHVQYAIDDFEAKKLESALMHACIAIEGTARKISSKPKAGRGDYKQCIRDYAWIIEPMIGGGIDQVKTIFTGLNIDDGSGKAIPSADLADVIYHIFRCNLAHSKSVPLEYRLLPSGDGWSMWSIGDGVLQMPDRIIWALLAVSVFSKANTGVVTHGNYYLTWGSEALGLGIQKFVIKDWWGREEDFKNFLSEKNPNPTRVTIRGL